MSTVVPLFAVTSHITGIDWVVIAIYFCILGGVAWWVIHNQKETADDYFLAGRNLGWWVIGASIFASNIGSEHIVGLAGTGATDGVALAHYELHAWCLLVLAWAFVPFYMRSQVFTMPEFLERRFNEKSRYVLSIVSIITFIVSKIAVGIFAGGVVFGTLMPELTLDLGPLHLDAFWIGSVLVIVLTGLYTALGGMRAVAYNDAVQVVVLIVGSAALTFYGLNFLGGWGELRRICGSDMFNLWKPMIPPGVEGTWAPVIERSATGELTRQAWYFNSYYPWVGMLICAPIVGCSRITLHSGSDSAPDLQRMSSGIPTLPMSWRKNPYPTSGRSASSGSIRRASSTPREWARSRWPRVVRSFASTTCASVFIVARYVSCTWRRTPSSSWLRSRSRWYICESSRANTISCAWTVARSSGESIVALGDASCGDIEAALTFQGSGCLALSLAT
jgi:hypothetical protein